MTQDLKITKLEFRLQNIKHYREFAGKTQTNLGEILKITFQQYQKYESGVNYFSLQHTINIAEYLECELFTLLFCNLKQLLLNTEAPKFSKEQKEFFMEVVNCFKKEGYLGLIKFFDDLRKIYKITYREIKEECIKKTIVQIGKYFTGKTNIPLKDFINLVNYFYIKKYLDN